MVLLSLIFAFINFVFSEAKRRKLDCISSPSSQVCHVIATFVILVIYYIKWNFGKYMSLKVVPFELELISILRRKCFGDSDCFAQWFAREFRGTFSTNDLAALIFPLFEQTVHDITHNCLEFGLVHCAVG